MKMSAWEQAYSELEQFVLARPEIHISRGGIEIPGGSRAEFYALFDAARRQAVMDLFPDAVFNAGTLSRNYLETAKAVTASLGLATISMEIGLGRYLQNPLDELMRPAYNPLFAVLKKECDATAFRDEISGPVATSAADYFRRGYRLWLILSLVRMLKADALLRVKAENIYNHSGHIFAGDLGTAPEPETSDAIAFIDSGVAKYTTLVPDLIFHSGRLNRYVAIRAELNLEADCTMASGASRYAPAGREWLELAKMPSLAPYLTLLYIADRAEEICLLADRDRMQQPDAVLAIVDGRSPHKRDDYAAAITAHKSLRPACGTFIIPVLPQPDATDGLDSEAERAGLTVLRIAYEKSEHLARILLRRQLAV